MASSPVSTNPLASHATARGSITESLWSRERASSLFAPKRLSSITAFPEIPGSSALTSAIEKIEAQSQDLNQPAPQHPAPSVPLLKKLLPGAPHTSEPQELHASNPLKAEMSANAPASLPHTTGAWSKVVGYWEQHDKDVFPAF
ncbi:hypothetical protein BC830DRAFT_1109924 [Chytriomyces sp. MP71]|nr:hypothetical protein BC830DRAFT_1109924 [Chytriomyces sp. MP71]